MNIGLNQNDIDFSVFKGQKVEEVLPIGQELVNIKFSNGSLNIECSWRLRNACSILVGYSERNEDAPSSKLKNHIQSKIISGVFHYLPTEDLTVEFENDVYLDLFADSSVFEQYQLYMGDNLFLIGK
ncbi:hypothetical protein [Paenibacillus contaminans]|uniref:hypothetical protein n=1 Tax=Paenibacillus contaminans TaxID=450362 RepID=UPI000DDB2206|nr:hypothetical protein [Paenibacillus contaminans]